MTSTSKKPAYKVPKQLKMKSYTVPQDYHFLFVQNPWPFEHERRGQRDFNSTILWLICCIHDLCGLTLHPSDIILWWQSTHRDFIVEVEIRTDPQDPQPSLLPVIGAHTSSHFLKIPGPHEDTAVIYEYNFEKKNHPKHTNWRAEYATFTVGPQDFPVKHQIPEKYPVPGPVSALAPRSDWAKPLPTYLREGHPDCLPIPTAQTAPVPLPLPAGNQLPLPLNPPPPPPTLPVQGEPHPVDHPSEFAFKPYERPPHFPVVNPPAPTKRDPYEQEAADLEGLRSLKQEYPADVKPFPKQEDTVPPLKRESADDEREREAMRFLQEQLDALVGGRVKQESTEDVKPFIKRESERDEEERAAMRVLQEQLDAQKRGPAGEKAASSSSDAVRVKTEPTNVPMPPPVKTEPSTVHQEPHSVVHIKAEPHDYSPALHVNTAENRPRMQLPVKTEPRDHLTVKQEHGAYVKKEEDDFDTRRGSRNFSPPRSMSANSRTYSPPSRVKQEDARRSVKREDDDFGYRGSQAPRSVTASSRTYLPSPQVKQEYRSSRALSERRDSDDRYRSAVPPLPPSGPSSFPRRTAGDHDYPMDDSRRSSYSFPQHDDRGYDRNRDSMTYSPSPSRKTNGQERPFKRERTESSMSRDPRVRPKMDA